MRHELIPLFFIRRWIMSDPGATHIPQRLAYSFITIKIYK